MADAEGYSPTVGKRRLAAILVDLRTQCEMTTTDVCRRLGISRWSLYRAESATWVKPQPALVMDLTELYGVPAEQAQALVQLSRDARKRGWWYSYKDVFGENDFIGFEAGASATSVYEPALITGLLQTPAYIERITRAAGITGEHDIARRVAARRQRQQILDRDEPPQLNVVLPETAIATCVGTAPERREQLEHLATMSLRDNITVALLRFDDGPHPASGTGPFTILDFADSRDRSIVYMETEVDCRYLEEPDELDRYRHLYNEVQRAALGPDDTRAHLAKYLDMLE